MSSRTQGSLSTIDIPQGRLTGQREGQIYRYSAIPYARPPVEDLRFQPPATDNIAWTGTLDATRSGPVAPQLPSRLADAMGDFQAEQSEDCLHLTVWTPAPDNRRRPVVIWLHGGAWQSGAGDLDWYDGTALAERGDIVVVAPNYRLAALGWLYVPGETANVGLLDQEAAIDWVIENIQDFGGDPENITLMGQSAGASSIAALMARKNRYLRVIIQSASLGRGWRSAAEAARLSELIISAAGASSLEHAQRLPYTALLEAQQAPEVLRALQQEGEGRALFSPVLDGEVITLGINESLAAIAAQADVLIGYTQHEMAAFPGGDISAQNMEIGDRIFGVHSREWAVHAKHQGRKAWLYRFDYAPTERFGACHCLELPFVFDTFHAFSQAPMLASANASATSRLTTHMQTVWLDFIRGTGPDLPQYPHLNLFE